MMTTLIKKEVPFGRSLPFILMEITCIVCYIYFQKNVHFLKLSKLACLGESELPVLKNPTRQGTICCIYCIMCCGIVIKIP